MRKRLMVLSMVLMLVAAACSDDDADDDGGAATPDTGAETEEPVRGGTLVVAVTSDPGGLNPAITTSGATHTVAELMFNGLVSIDEELQPSGELAESWDVEENGAVYRFTLRDGVTWHDGTPFTSADVKYTFDEMLLKLHGRARASIGPALAGIETPDARTVVFRFKAPYAPLLQQLNVTEAPILPRHVYEGTDVATNPANNAPVGTGPFKFVSYTQGAEIRVARNPTYFKEGLPYLDEVVQRVIPIEANQVLALERGEVDWVWNVPGVEQERLRANPDIELVQTAFNPGGANCIMTMSFNLDKPILQDLRVRQAIAHSLDRQQFLDQILFDEGRVATAPISSGIGFAHAEDVDLPAFDRARAGSLLDEAGWPRQGEATRTASGVEGVPDGTPLAIDYLHFPTFAKYGELTRQQLGAVGIEVTQKPLEPSVFSGVVFRDRNFDTNVISYCNATDPEIGVRRMFDSAQIGPAPFTNAAAYRNAEVDGLFQQASQVVDQDARGDLYGRIQEIVAGDLPYVWLVETLGTRGHQSECTGFKAYTGLFAEAAFCRR